jgi:hypothetical protein
MQKDEWATLDLPFEDFKPVFRARTDHNAAPFDPSRVHSLQIMLSKFEYDGELNPNFRPGPFELPISSIEAYLPHATAPRFVHVSSAGVRSFASAEFSMSACFHSMRYKAARFNRVKGPIPIKLLHDFKDSPPHFGRRFAQGWHPV